MTREVVREILNRGVQDVREPDVEQVIGRAWASARGGRRRRAAWGGSALAGLAAATLAAVVWGPGLTGGDVMVTPDPAQSGDGTSLQGEPYAVLFAGQGASDQAGGNTLYGTWVPVSGSAEPARTETVQGTWTGEHGETIEIDGDVLTLISGCDAVSAMVTLDAAGQLTADTWQVTAADGPDCAATETAVPSWSAALQNGPLLSLDGDVLIVSGFDGQATATDRSPASITLRMDQERRWTTADPVGEDEPLTLAEGQFLTLSGAFDDDGVTNAVEVGVADEGGCPQQYATTLRSDGVLLFLKDQGHFSGCDPTQEPVQVDPAVHALLASHPTLGIEGDQMTITGTVPTTRLDSPQSP
jgi:hypothetical protein